MLSFTAHAYGGRLLLAADADFDHRAFGMNKNQVSRTSTSVVQCLRSPRHTASFDSMTSPTDTA